MRIPFNDWLSRIDRLLRLMGYKHTALSEAAWKELYDEGFSPFKAISESEFDGKLTWHQMRKLQNFKPIWES